ncbi:TraR/DksA family transcriptional regulator [Moraxella macacae 0408225]|uniref:TraR/DksA family transcriptional regulator n=1 Tax=Moraxella macacae 0408225 TaxID=1230338 RepID=L2FBA9_9GAMM|nr:TraR/DksA C4-type zinc finger protein [Moraxella macacae]ELA09723.1 TraR/DksA family transcriptional regulator [Moraxella macacae 0408225]
MSDLAKHKADLLDLKTEYETRIQKITDHIHHPPDELNQHWDDQAVSATENDMRKNLLLEAEYNLDLVNSALMRLENDSYGICSDCGEDIEEKRLDIVPYATKCMTHAK